MTNQMRRKCYYRDQKDSEQLKNVQLLSMGMNHEENNECIDNQLKMKDLLEEAQMSIIYAVVDGSIQIQENHMNAVV